MKPPLHSHTWTLTCRQSGIGGDDLSDRRKWHQFAEKTHLCVCSREDGGTSPVTKPHSAAHVPLPLGSSGSRRAECTLIPRGVFRHSFYVLIITQTDHRSAAVSCQHSCPEASKPWILSMLSHAYTNVVTFKLPDGAQLNRKRSGDLRFLTQLALLKMQGFCRLWLN